MNGDDGTNGKDGASGAPRCPDCSGPLTAVDPLASPAAIAARWPLECVPCARLFSDIPPQPDRDRDFVIADQIAMLGREPRAVLADVSAWALEALRNEATLRIYLRRLRTLAGVEAAEIELRLGER